GEAGFRVIGDTADHALAEQGNDRLLAADAPALDRRRAVVMAGGIIGAHRCGCALVLPFRRQFVAFPPRPEARFHGISGSIPRRFHSCPYMLPHNPLSGQSLSETKYRRK